MSLKVVNYDSTDARLANIRIVIMDTHADYQQLRPDYCMDLIFTPDACEIQGFNVTDGHDTLTLGTSNAKIEHEMPKDWSGEIAWIDHIKSIEKRMWDSWISGNVYDVEVQRWNPDMRCFDVVEHQTGLYGMPDALEFIRSEWSAMNATCLVNMTNENIVHL